VVIFDALLMPAEVTAKTEIFFIAFFVESGGRVHRHSANGVLVHGFRLIHRQDIYLPFHFSTALRAASFLGYFSRLRRFRHGVKPGLAFQTRQGISHQFLRHLPVEDFLHGQGDDDFGAALEERCNLLQRIRSEIERHEEAFSQSSRIIMASKECSTSTPRPV
jgi:hypothetical protein